MSFEDLKAVIVHGTGGEPGGNWFPWLRTELEDLGARVYIPAFPTPEGQSPESWFKVFDSEVGAIDQNTVLIGHSVGAVFLLHLLQRSHTPVRGSIFAAGFVKELGIPDFDPYLAPFFAHPFDWTKIRSNSGFRLVYAGDDDPYVKLEQGEELARSLNTELQVINGGKHLNREAGFLTFELLLKDLLSQLRDTDSSGRGERHDHS